MNAIIFDIQDGSQWASGLRIESAEADVFQAFIADLKASVPRWHRTWDADGKRWLFSAGERGMVEGLLRLHGLTFKHEELEPIPVGIADPYEALHLLPTAPDELVKVAYKIMAKRAHPDHGGRHEDMLALNAAYEEIVA